MFWPIFSNLWTVFVHFYNNFGGVCNIEDFFVNFIDYMIFCVILPHFKLLLITLLTIFTTIEQRRHNTITILVQFKNFLCRCSFTLFWKVFQTFFYSFYLFTVVKKNVHIWQLKRMLYVYNRKKYLFLFYFNNISSLFRNSSPFISFFYFFSQTYEIPWISYQR